MYVLEKKNNRKIACKMAVSGSKHAFSIVKSVQQPFFSSPDNFPAHLP